MRILVLTTVALFLALSGCGGNRARAPVGNAEKLYDMAKRACDNGNYKDAITYYEQLEARFPFSNPARQGQLDLMYAYYIKGLTQFERNPNFLERWFNADLTERPPIDARKSFQAFQTVVERFPNSEYAEDSRRRMIFLRNRLASYEVYVADYYLKRGAWVGAINRSKYCIENYDGAPQVKRALEIMAQSYHKLGMEDLAADSEKVLKENYANVDPNEKKKSWWKIW